MFGSALPVCLIPDQLWTYKFLDAVTMETCMMLCMETNNIPCHSIYYDKSTSFCHMVPFNDKQRKLVQNVKGIWIPYKECHRNLNSTILFLQRRKSPENGMFAA